MSVVATSGPKKSTPLCEGICRAGPGEPYLSMSTAWKSIYPIEPALARRTCTRVDPFTPIMAMNLSMKTTIDPMSVKYAERDVPVDRLLGSLCSSSADSRCSRKYSADFSNCVVLHRPRVVAIYYRSTRSRTVDGMFDNICCAAHGGLVTLCMAISLSYFTYDLIYCALGGDFMSVVHHMFTMGGLASGVLNGRSGAELVACLFLMEVSNPSLHLRTVFIEMGLKTSMLASINSLVFALMFLMCRLVIGPPLVWKTLASPDNDYIVKAGGFGILAVSVFWGMSIIRIIVKEVKKLMGRGRRSRHRRINLRISVFTHNEGCRAEPRRLVNEKYPRSPNQEWRVGFVVVVPVCHASAPLWFAIRAKIGAS